MKLWAIVEKMPSLLVASFSVPLSAQRVVHSLPFWGALAALVVVIAGSALPPPSRQLEGQQIASSQFMPVLTMGLPCLSRHRADATADVLAYCDRLKMVRPNTERISAEVVNGQSMWDRPFGHFVSMAVGGNVSALVVNEAIATVAGSSNPFPTARLADHIANRVGSALTGGGVELNESANHRVKYSGFGRGFLQKGRALWP